MSNIVAKQLLETALGNRVSYATEATVLIGYEVLMFRERQLPKWIEPYVVKRFIQGENYLELGTGNRIIPASNHKMKKYISQGGQTEVETSNEEQEEKQFLGRFGKTGRHF